MLSQLGATFEERHILKAPPSEEELYRFADRLPGGIIDLFAEKSKLAKELDIAALTKEKDGLLNVLAEQPGLLRRPIVTDGCRVVVGYHEAALRSLVSSNGEK